MIKPILFSTPMVQAILDGRKTMTRRVVKPQPRPENSYFGGIVTSSTDNSLIGCVGFCRSALAVCDHDYRRPRYQPGDILWVRETWFCDECDPDCAGRTEKSECTFNHVGDCCYGYKTQYTEPIPSDMKIKWRPSIFMPKEAARIFLRVTDVRVERVQDILCGDMKREGCIPETATGGHHTQWKDDYWIPLWDNINAKRGYPWSSNPWVWVISFERTDKPELEAMK